MNNNSTAASVDFLGLRFDPLTQDQAVETITQLAWSDRFHFVVTPNVDHVVRLHREEPADTPGRLWDAYRQATLSLCDSRILTRLARMSGITLPIVTGSDLTARLLEQDLPAGMRVLLIGGSPAQYEWLTKHCARLDFSQHIPPMGLRRNEAAQQEVVTAVETAQADIILFAIGSPQSELLCTRLACSPTARGVALCIGASIEFLTGEKARAPKFMQQLSLEWLFRLLSEPCRLWRRYLVEGPAIFRLWLRWDQTRRKA